MSALQLAGTRQSDTAALAADPRRLRHGEGRTSFANLKIAEGIRQLVIQCHLARISEPQTPESSKADPEHGKAHTVAFPATEIRVSFSGQIDLADMVKLESASSTILWTPGPSLVSGSNEVTTVLSPLAGLGLIYSGGRYTQVTSLTNNTPVAPVLAWSVSDSFGTLALLNGVGWAVSGFGPGLSVRVASGVGTETNVPTEEDVREMEIEDFLGGIYALVASGRAPAAMDAVFDHLDRLLNDGFFRACDALLTKVELERMPSSVRRAFLAVTRPAKQELPSRAAFYNEALRLLSQERDEATARRMLKSLA